jgi:tyrosine-protein phosphatase SIW14
MKDLKQPRKAYRGLNQVGFVTVCSRPLIAGLLLAATVPFAATGANVFEGIGNFQKVNDHVYRGAQPTEHGFLNLAKLGVRTVIDLQESGDARALGEAKSVKAAGMQYISVPMRGMETPSNASVTKVLSLLEDTATGPVFVHCHRGADRTGGVIACYRIEHDHWTNDHALAEAKSLGMSWYQQAIQRYVRNYQPRIIDAPAPALAGVVPAAAIAPADDAPASAGSINIR